MSQLISLLSKGQTANGGCKCSARLQIPVGGVTSEVKVGGINGRDGKPEWERKRYK